MMDTPNDHGWISQNFPWIVALTGGLAVIFKKWALELNPIRGLRWFAEIINGPIFDKRMQPLHARFDKVEVKMDGQGGKIDKVARVIVHMDGGKEALAAVNQEDEQTKRW